jgi:hypothetical protein
MSRMITPPPRTATGPGVTALAQTVPSESQSAVLAETLPSGTQQPVRSRAVWPFIAGGLGALVLGAVVFFVVHRNGETKPPSPPPPPKAAIVTPPPPVVIDAAPAVVPVIDAAPATVAITIDKAPAGSEIVLGDKVLGTAPGPIMIDRGSAAVTLTVRKAGFTSKTIDVTPDADRTIDAPLAPVHAHHTTSHDSHDIEDPFSK